MRKIKKELIEKFSEFLVNEEKSTATICKYVHDISAFMNWIGDNELNKVTVLNYKQELIQKYAPASVNVTISSLNSFFTFMKWYDIRIKALKIQRQLFSNKDKELSRTEYERLLTVAKRKRNRRLYYVMQTICSTGIRVSEIKYVTVEAISCGKANINCKGKMRVVFLTRQLCEMLEKYAKNNNIKSGPIFVTKNGKPLDRSNIWSEMKSFANMLM